MEENNLNVTPSNKQSNGMMAGIVIGILIALVVGMGAYIVFDKVINKDKEETQETTPAPTATPTTNTKEELDINDATVQKLYKIFNYEDSNNCIVRNENLNKSNLVRLMYAFWQLSDSDKKTISCSLIEKKLADGNVCGTSGSTESTISFDNSTLKAKYNELFGTNYEYKAEDFDFMTEKTSTSYCSPFHYIKDKDIFAKYSGECGGDCPGVTQTLVSAYKEGDKLYIKTTYKVEDLVKKADYEFKLENGNYTFVKVVEE